MEAGFHALRWDGSDASGRLARSGVYFIRAEHGGETANLRFALVR
jgi:hypothetical protein